jgi:hypothetical protein
MPALTILCRYGQQVLASRSPLLSQTSRFASVGESHFLSGLSKGNKSSFSTLRIVQEADSSDDVYEAHERTDQLEFIDVIMDKAVEIEESIDRLQTLYSKKKEVALNVQYMDAADIEALFQESEKQKKFIRELVLNVKELSHEVKGRFNGVDAPDGTSDDMAKREMDAVDAIIYYAWEQQKRDAQAIKIKANCHSGR